MSDRRARGERRVSSARDRHHRGPHAVRRVCDRPQGEPRARAARGGPSGRPPRAGARGRGRRGGARSEEHTSELQSLAYLVCRLLLEKKKNTFIQAAVSGYHIKHWCWAIRKLRM